jgi:IS5 family transposase
VATVMVLQALEGLSDREAGSQLRQNIAWKVACGLALTDQGFHPTVLTLWRSRLRASDRPERILETVRAVIAQTRVLAGRHRRALDSTLLDDAVATQDTVTQLVGAIRRVRRLVPAAAMLVLGAPDYDHDPGKPACVWDDAEARDQLVSALVGDATAVLATVKEEHMDGDQAEAVGLLALVAGQDVEPGDAEGSWRIARKVAADRVISVVDPQARHLHKSVSSYRDGYKAHVAAEPETGLVTAAALTPANAADGPTGVSLLDGEGPGLEVLADAAYGGETRAALTAAGHAQQSTDPAAASGAGRLHQDDFAIDLHAGTVTCPAGHNVAITPGGRAVFDWRCRPVSAPRALHTRQGRQDGGPASARGGTCGSPPKAGTPAFQASYRRWRPMVERSIAWLVANGHRRVRYRGLARNQLGLSLRVAAIDLRRLVTMGLDYGDAGWVLA